MDVVMNNIPLICTLVGVAGVVFAIILAGIVKGAPAGNEKMQAIAGAIQEGAIAYLNRQLKSMGIAGIIIFGVIFATMGAKTAFGFMLGAVASFMAGYIGMRVSVLANVRTAEAAKKGMAAGLSMAFKGGSVTGMIVAGLALTSVAGYYTATHDVIALVALGFGGSLISIFARLGGGIFTKGADVGADLVGKVEAGIPEDDPATRRSSPTTWATTSATAPAWPPTCSRPMPSPRSPPCCSATCCWAKIQMATELSRWCSAPFPSSPPSSHLLCPAGKGDYQASWAPCTRACSVPPSWRRSLFAFTY
jgi:hypothetical protein